MSRATHPAVTATLDRMIADLERGFHSHPQTVPYELQDATRAAIELYRNGCMMPEDALLLAFVHANALSNLLRFRLHNSFMEMGGSFAL